MLQRSTDIAMMGTCTIALICDIVVGVVKTIILFWIYDITLNFVGVNKIDDLVQNLNFDENDVGVVRCVLSRSIDIVGIVVSRM